MKKLFFIPIIFFVCNIGIAQQNTFNKEAELQKFVERGGKVEGISTNIYKLTYSEGTQRVFNFNTVINQNSYIEGFDNTTINVWEIDTTLYADKFKFWQKVDIANGIESTVPIEDINQNGFLELYGMNRYTFPPGGQAGIVEQDSQHIFHTVYNYDPTSIFVQGVGDVNSDGIKEVYLRTRDTLSGKFYKADSLGEFPTTFDFIFYYYTTSQINDITFGDFDQNGVTDCSFIDWPIIYLATYDSSINNFYEVFEYNVNDFSSGFAINDFDGDGKTELVLGTSLQQVYVIEAVDTNQYSLSWQGLAPTLNAYMVTSTNDIDGNGKPEFWIGGQDFNTGISTFWCYEADGDNSYIPVAGIELRYLVSLFTFYLLAVDVDNDETEELVINLQDYLLILKFTGKPDQHNYSIFYAKIGEETQPSAIFLPPTIYDLNGDGKKDILLPMDIYPPPYISHILVQDKITSVAENNDKSFDKFDLSQNYPNPFNPSTQIKITVKEQNTIQVVVYNLLGKEIKLMLNENLPNGEYTIQWDGKDNEGNILTGGVYFIRMIAGNYQKTIKTILLK
jgi:hypothetical protein